MLAMLPGHWQALFPQLELLSRHYRLATLEPLPLRAVLRAIDLAALGEAARDPAIASLLTHLLGVSAASFAEVLTSSERELLGPLDDLLPYLRHHGETLQDYVRRIVVLCEMSSSSSGLDLEGILPLCMRVEVLLTQGGDDRMTLNMEAGKVNKYLSSSIPTTRRLIRRGSCTCSTVTEEDYIKAEEFRARCLQAALRDRQPINHSTLNDGIRSRLLKVVGLDENHYRAVLFPSGSDAELFPLLTALLRHAKAAGFETSDTAVVNIVTAAGEVGR